MEGTEKKIFCIRAACSLKVVPPEPLIPYSAFALMCLKKPHSTTKQAPAEMLQKPTVCVILQTKAQYSHLLFAPQGEIFSVYSLYVYLQAKGLGD